MEDLAILIEAVKQGDLGRVTEIVRSAPSLASARLPDGESALMAALYRGHHHVVDALIDAGAEVDVFAAAATGRTDDLRGLLSTAGSVSGYSYDGWTPLHLAAFFGHLAAARLLLDAGAEVNAVSKNSLTNTPLHAATAGKHVEVALLLLERGAASDAVDAGEYTPLAIATQNHLTAVVDAIVDGRK
jgi:ankyrin repeat protein